MSSSFLSCLLVSNTPILSLDTFEEFYRYISDTSVQSWATTITPKLRAQYPTRMGQVRSEYRSGKPIDDADRYVQLYRPSLAA